MIETAADPRLALGTYLRDKWRLDKLLGRGGMATVFAATHRNGARAAVKVLHPELARDPQIKGRLLREGYVANAVQHPGIVRVLDDDVTEDGLVFLVMDLLEGETIKERWIREGRELPPLDVVDIAIAILEILSAAHQKGVVHRDIKPDNIFMVEGGGVRLLDFGIARLREGAADATHTGAMLGTPAFMAPEQALARWDQVDGRSDLFALGATIWTLISGRLVHSAKTIPELLVATATKQAEPFSSVAPGLPDELYQVVDRALVFEQQSRWPSAGEMLEATRAARVSLVCKGTVRLDPEANPFHEAEPRAPLTAAVPVSSEPVTAKRETGPNVALARTDVLQVRAPNERTQLLPAVEGAVVRPAVKTRPMPRTLASSALHLEPSDPRHPTPIRLQEPWPALPRAAERPVTAPATSTTVVTRRPKSLTWLGALAGVAAGAAAVTYLALPSDTATSDDQRASAPSSELAPSSVAGPPTTPPAVTATPTATTTASFGASSAPSATAPPVESTSQSATAPPRPSGPPKPPGTSRPVPSAPPKPCAVADIGTPRCS